MTQQVVDVGSSANDGTGDPIRTSMIKINDNFTEVYTELGGASLSNLSLTGNSIISDDTNGQIILDPNGTGDVIITSGNLGISTSTPVARLEVEDNASTASMLVKITADDQTPWGLIIGNDTFSTTDTDGLSVAVDDAGKASLIVRGASSTLAFGTVATEFMKMDATGQVGITQATPLANLHVTNASSAVTAVTAQQAKGIIIEGSLQAQLTFLNTTSGFGSIAWTDANSATLGEIKYDHNGNILSFTSNTAEVMRFNAAGDMSVGNTNGDYSQLGIVGPVLNVGGADNGWVQTTHTDAANDETVGAFYSADQNGLGSGMSLWRETGNSMLLRLTYRDAGLNVVEGFRLNGLGNVIIGNSGTGPSNTYVLEVEGNISNQRVELIDNQVRATITNENLILDANGTGVVSVSSNFEVAGDNFRVVTPQTPAGVGVSGDLPGMFAYDSAYIYICTGVYDGSTAIWRRSLMASF